MAFTAEEIVNINNSTLEYYIDKGKVLNQNRRNKPMMDAFDRKSGRFPGGNLYVSVGVKGNAHLNALEGYTHDDQVGYANLIGVQRARYPWKEHHIGLGFTQTEAKIDGIDIVENGTDQTMRDMSGREEQALANLIENKMDDLSENYAHSFDLLLHGDGSADPKAIAGIGAFLLANPNTGTTGGLSRVTYPYWRNRAATAAFGTAGGQGAITSSNENGGALISFMDEELRFRNQFAGGGTDTRYFCGSDFINAYRREFRANGMYYQNTSNRKPDGSLEDPSHNGIALEWDPTMDNLGLSKRCYAIDMGRNGLRFLYMNGQRMKKHNPARPYDRYMVYNAITMTGVLTARQLNTSGVYDIA